MLGILSLRCVAFAAVFLSAATPATAQDLSTDETEEFVAGQGQRQAVQDTPAGQTAESSVGQVGQRQTREEAAPNVAPTGRIANRIQNRVQSRVRNRIDRYYDPQANAASPFATAEDQAREAGRPR